MSREVDALAAVYRLILDSKKRAGASSVTESAPALTDVPDKPEHRRKVITNE